MLGFWISYGVGQNMAPSTSWYLMVDDPLCYTARPCWATPDIHALHAGIPTLVSEKRPHYRGHESPITCQNLPRDHPYVKNEIYEMEASIEEEARTAGTSFWRGSW